MPMMQTYTRDHVEASLCAWEWCLNNKSPEWSERISDIGTCTLREWCIDLGPYINSVYEALNHDVRSDVPFDWDIVPRIMERIEFAPDAYTEPPFKTPSVTDMAAMVERDIQPKG